MRALAYVCVHAWACVCVSVSTCCMVGGCVRMFLRVHTCVRVGVSVCIFPANNKRHSSGILQRAVVCCSCSVLRLLSDAAAIASRLDES